MIFFISKFMICDIQFQNFQLFDITIINLFDIKIFNFLISKFQGRFLPPFHKEDSVVAVARSIYSFDKATLRFVSNLVLRWVAALDVG